MEYTIIRKKIKSFIIRVYPDKNIKISVPLRATNKEIENFIISKKYWLEKTLKKIEQKLEEKNKLDVEEKKIIKIFEEIYRKNIILFREEKIVIENNNFNIFILEEKEEKINKLVLEYKLEILSKKLEEYIEKYSKLLNAEISFYKIKNLKTAWGIYHKKQNYISFNFDLIHKNKKFVEYVVLHEMCHIFHMNHQKDFWKLVEKYMPDYKELRNSYR